MNTESETVEDFADKYDIDDAYMGSAWQDMVDERWDGIVIATHVDGLAEALEYCLTDTTPVLVEKPVAWDSETIRSLAEEAHSNVIVNYHRRYYRTVRRAREFLADHRPVMATIELPETDDTLKTFLRKSCHGVDKIRYLFGDVDILDNHALTEEDELLGFTATLQSQRGDLINLIANWTAPSNKGINIDHGNVRFQIEPYEQARKYRGFRVEEPTEETPFKQYIPDEIETINLDAIDREFKPGFHQQASNFEQMITDETRPTDAATLHDAADTIRLCEEMLPDHLPASINQ